MSTLTHVAPDGLYRDEPLPLSPLLANALLPEEPVPVLKERLALLDGWLFVFREDEGGGLWDERCLGSLLGVSDWDVPDALRDEFWRLVGEETDARQFGRDCKNEALKRY